MENNRKRVQSKKRKTASNTSVKRKKRTTSSKKKKKTTSKKYVYYRDAQGNLRRRKVKRSYKRLKYIIFAGIVAIFAILYIVTRQDSIALSKLGYSGKEKKVILSQTKEEIQEYLDLDHAIDFSTWDEYSNDQHYYDYELYESLNPELAEISVIHYVDSFYDIYDELEILDFTKDYCRQHWDSWTMDQYDIFIDNRIDYETVEKYMAYSEFNLDDLKDYVDSEYSGIEAIMHVTYNFIDSNYSTEDTYYIEDCENIGIITKEGFTMNSYEPTDLVECSVTTDSAYYGNFKMRKEAATALANLFKAAKKAGYNLQMQDAYISYDEYQDTFSSLASQYGNVFARNQVGTPGSNEHQTGLAVDITCETYKNTDEEDIRNTTDYKWLCEHAHEYGYIIRYPEGKDDITGVQGEYEKPSEHIHLRYVGEEMATDIYDMDMTLEEYILTYGFGYDISLIEEDD